MTLDDRGRPVITQEMLDEHYFMDNVREARDNGYDAACVQCGVGLAGDDMDMDIRAVIETGMQAKYIYHAPPRGFGNVPQAASAKVDKAAPLPGQVGMFDDQPGLDWGDLGRKFAEDKAASRRGAH